MQPLPRRGLLTAAVTTAIGGLPGCLDGEDGTTPNPPVEDSELPDEVALDGVATGLRRPVDLAFAPDGDRRYVVQQEGRVLVHDGSLREEPFLDLRDAVSTSHNEMGLLGIALHPEFADNRRLFLRYSAPPRSGTPDGYSHTFVLSEFEATDDGTRALPESERTLLEVPEPQGNHNSGNVLFGPDGYLYVPVGDGGSGRDQGGGHVEDWYDAVGGGNGQDVTENLLGSILRIDVDGGGGRGEYAIPEDNPLVGDEGFDEHYAWGFRNPWGCSFDGEDFFVADVGQYDYEEVDLVEQGENYGWNVKEGTHCFQANECPDRTPSDVRGGEPFVDPIVEYPHGGEPISGRSVIGGHVYRGKDISGLEGAYVFGDLDAGGRLFVATRPDDPNGLWPTGVLDIDVSLDRILAFGQDRDGKVYVLGVGSDGSGVYQVVSA